MEAKPSGKPYSPAGVRTYLIAVGATAAVGLVRFLLAGLLGEVAPFLPFILSVAVTAWHGGLRPGLVATALGGVAGFLLVTYPHLPDRIGHPGVVAGLLVYLATGVAVCWLCEALHSARSRADQERELLRVTLASMGDAVITTDTEGRVASLNPVAADLTGWAEDQAIGKPLAAVFKIVNEQTGQPVENPVEKVLQHGQAVGLANHTVLITKDGTQRHIDDSAAPIRDGNGRVVGVVLVFHDISERRRAEQGRLDALRLKQVITDNATTGIIMQDGTGRCTFMNPAAEQMTGFTFEELRGENVHDHIHHTHPDGRHFPMSECEIGKAVMAMKPIRRHEDLFVRKDGTFFPVVCNASPVQQGGRLTEVVLEFRDITEERRVENQLRQQTENLQTLLDALPVGVFIAHDPDCRKITGNRAAYELLRVPPPDNLSLTAPAEEQPANFRVLQNGTELQPDGLPVQRAAKGERVWQEELDLVFADGSTVAEVVSAVPLLDARGQVRGAVGVVQDVTRERRASDALRESEGRLRLFIEHAPAAIAMFDRDMRYLAASRRWLADYGLGVQNVIGKSHYDFFPEIPDRWREVHRRGLAGEVLKAEEDPFERADGSVQWIRWEVRPWYAGKGEVGGIIIMAEEITARKEAEDRLRESERRLRFVMDSMPQKIFTARPNGDVDYFNPQWTDFTGLSFEAIRDWGWTQFIHPDDLAENVRAWRHSVETGEPFRFEHRFRRADGQYRWHYSRAVPMRDEAGRIVLWIGSNTDVHEVKQSQEALRESDRRKDEFLAMLAHELRNPLAPIRNAVQVLRLTGPQDGPLQHVRDMIDRQVSYMVRLVDDLLDVSRITRGKIALRQEPVDLAGVVASAVESSRPLIDARRHDLHVSLPPDPVRVEGDLTRLAQVVLNLLNNSAKYTPEGGHITLTVECRDGEAVVRVRDDGVGIAPALLPNVFDMFTQAERTLDRSQGGLGLGLTLVKKLVEMHGGSVEARSGGLGQGSEFVVRLPALSGPARPGWAGQGGEPEGAQAAAARRRVLVVDDNVDAADSLAMLLRLMGNDVRSAYDGPTALDLLPEYRPDVVFLDIGLPGMDGYEVSRRLRRLADCRNVVLVALTGYGSAGDRRRSDELGFYAHLVKPVHPADLEKLLAGLAEPARK